VSATELFVDLGETTLAVGVLIALVLMARRPFTHLFGPRAAYLLWLAPLARLALPELNILPAPVSENMVFVSASAGVIQSFNPAHAGFDWLGAGAALALFLWIAIAVAWIAIRLGEHRRMLNAAYRESIPAGQNLQREATAVARELGMRRTPKVRTCATDSGPAVIGLFRPTIFLPATFDTNYSPDERRLALAHECAHIVRGDLTASFAAFILQALQWPNPLAHFAAKAFRIDQEAACDAYVLARCRGKNSAGDYASAILKSVRAAAPAYGLSLGHPLKERLMILKKPAVSFGRRLMGGAAAIALSAAGVAATASYGYAAPGDDAEVKAEKEVVKEKRVLVFTGVEDEIIFDDVVIGDRVRVMEFDDGNGERRVIRIDGDNIEKDVDIISMANGEGGVSWSSSGCVHKDGEGEPVMLEFKEETGDADDKSVFHTVICLTGEEASPENRAAALEMAIAKIEERAKKDEERRKKLIKSLRKQAKELKDAE